MLGYKGYTEVEILLIVLLGVVVFICYFVPSSIAIKREVECAAVIICINVLLGWTLLGWLVCLILALTTKTKADTRRELEQLKLQQQQIMYMQRMSSQMANPMWNYMDNPMLNPVNNVYGPNNYGQNNYGQNPFAPNVFQSGVQNNQAVNASVDAEKRQN